MRSSRASYSDEREKDSASLRDTWTSGRPLRSLNVGPQQSAIGFLVDFLEKCVLFMHFDTCSRSARENCRAIFVQERLWNGRDLGSRLPMQNVAQRCRWSESRLVGRIVLGSVIAGSTAQRLRPLMVP
jgi:hypothetical protein